MNNQDQSQIKDLIKNDDKKIVNAAQIELHFAKLYRDIIEKNAQFQSKIEEGNRKSINTLIVFSFLISLAVSVLVVIANSFSPFLQIFKKVEWYYTFLYVALTNVGIFLFAYWSFKQVLKSIIKFLEK